MQFIEKLKGKGTVTSASGEEVEVEYDLSVYQKEIRVPNMSDLHGTVSGPRELRGRITPVVFLGQGAPTLTLKDGSKLTFLFRDRDGNINFVEWLLDKTQRR